MQLILELTYGQKLTCPEDELALVLLSEWNMKGCHSKASGAEVVTGSLQSTQRRETETVKSRGNW
jgi:hypothetical protein